MAVSADPAKVLMTLGSRPWAESTLGEHVCNEAVAKKLPNSKQKSSGAMMARAYANSWLAVNTLSTNMIPAEPELKTKTAVVDYDAALASTLLAPGKGQLVFNPRMHYP